MERASYLLHFPVVWDDERMKMCGKALGHGEWSPSAKNPQAFGPSGFGLGTSLATPFTILSTSRTSILGLNSANGEGFMPSPFASGVPRDAIGKRNPYLLVWDDEKIKRCGKALGVTW